MRNAVLSCSFVALLVVPAASAHVTIQPDRVRRGSTATVTFTVPNERSKARIVGFDVRLPSGVSAVGGRSRWSVAIAPGQTRRFRLALRLPDHGAAVQLVAEERFSDGTTDTFYPLVTLTGRGLAGDLKLALLTGVVLLALAVGAFFVALARWLRS